MSHNARALFQISAAMSCNRLLFWLKKIPLVKRLFPDRLYGAGEAKTILTAVVEGLKLLWAFVGKFLYLCLAIALPLFFLGEVEGLEEAWPMAVQMLVALSFWAGCFLASDVMTATLLRYTCVRQMGMEARTCLLLTAGRVHVVNLLTFTPALVAAAFLCGQGGWAGLALSAELACARLVGEWAHIAFYSRTGKVPSRNAWYVMGVGLGALAAAYLPLLFQVVTPIGRWMLHPAALLLWIAAGGLCLRWMLAYPRCRELVYDVCSPEHVSAEVAGKGAAKAAFRDVELRDCDFTPEEGDRQMEGRKGYAYLNALFFKRHRRLLVRPVKLQLIGVGAVLALGLAACLLFRPVMAEAMEGIGLLLPPFVFFMYLLCSGLGTRICKAMFYNCDISLLRYPWYRDKRVILKNFTIRLGQVATLNLLVAGAICLAFLVLIAASGARPPMGELIPFLLSLLGLAVFFSVHPLFLYYVFQPYTTQLAVKNPFFTGLNLAVYAICYLCIQIKQPPAGFALLVLAATLLYSAVALFLVWRRAPRTFRVK